MAKDDELLDDQISEDDLLDFDLDDLATEEIHQDLVEFGAIRVNDFGKFVIIAKGVIELIFQGLSFINVINPLKQLFEIQIFF